MKKNSRVDLGARRQASCKKLTPQHCLKLSLALNSWLKTTVFTFLREKHFFSSKSSLNASKSHLDDKEISILNRFFEILVSHSKPIAENWTYESSR